MLEFIHIIALTIIFLATFFLGRMLSPSILHPIRIFSVVWCAFVLVPLFLWDVGYRWTFDGLYWIAAAVLAMEVGGLVAKKCFLNSHRPLQCDAIPTGKRELEASWVWLCAVLCAGMLFLVSYMATHKISVGSLSSFQSLLDINAQAAEDRYSGARESTSVFTHVLLIAVYMGSACGGYAFNFATNKRQKLVSVLTLLPIVATMLLENAKAGFIASVFLWFGGWCISCLRIHGHLPAIRWGLLWRLLLLGSAFIVVLYFVMLLRVGDFSAPMRELIFNKLLDYAFGQMIQFDGWFHGEAKIFADGLGINTYIWLPNLLGIAERAQGVYVPYVTDFNNNIFTAFRSVLEDFGIFLGLFYMALRGFCTEYAFCRIAQTGKVRILSSMLILCSYLWILYGFIISPWIYSSYALAMVGFGVFVFLFHSIVKIRL